MYIITKPYLKCIAHCFHLNSVHVFNNNMSKQTAFTLPEANPFSDEINLFRLDLMSCSGKGKGKGRCPLAQSRWKLLSAALIKSSAKKGAATATATAAEVIRYPSFGLVNLVQSDLKEQDRDRKWVHLKCQGFPELELKARKVFPDRADP